MRLGGMLISCHCNTIGVRVPASPVSHLGECLPHDFDDILDCGDGGRPFADWFEERHLIDILQGTTSCAHGTQTLCISHTGI